MEIDRTERAELYNKARKAYEYCCSNNTEELETDLGYSLSYIKPVDKCIKVCFFEIAIEHTLIEVWLDLQKNGASVGHYIYQVDSKLDFQDEFLSFYD